jgi:hypothetical protein
MMICPHCSSTNIRHSESARWDDFLRRAGDRQAFRCRVCRHRFFASTTSETLARVSRQSARKRRRHQHIQTRKEKRLVRRIITVAVFLLMFSVFGLLLHYLSVDHAGSGNQPDSTAPSE